MMAIPRANGATRAGNCWSARININGRPIALYATLMIEILKDNARPEAGAVYDAIEMDWAKLVGQIAKAYGH